jgi:Lamin Tail Domain
VTRTTVQSLRPPLLGVLAVLGLACAPSSNSPIRLNEILPSNSNNCPDEVGERNDWVELYNTSDLAVDLAGYSLTDDTATPEKSVIPAGVMIEARSAVLFWADATPDQGKTHLTFKFKSKAEGVILYDPDVRQVDLYRWTDAYSDVSFARVPDGTGAFVRCAVPTCGEDNSSACGN